MNKTSTATIRYYRGLIRELEARCKILENMIDKLEEEVKNLSSVNIIQPSNLQVFKEVNDNLLANEYPYLREGDDVE